MYRPQSRGKLFAAVSAALIVAIAGSGCSTLLDPYVRAKELKELSVTDAGGVAGLEKVMIAAEKQREAYYGAISERAKTRNALPLVLLPLTAMTLYRGITTTTDAGRRMVLEMGLLGAAYYSTANWFLSAPRERIYLAGTLALSCAIHAAEPYLASKPMQNDLAANLPRLDDAIERADVLQQRLANLMRLKAEDDTAKGKPAGRTTTTARAESQIDVARALVARGREVARVAHQLQAQTGNMAGELRQAVNGIVYQVDRQIEATEPEPAAVLRAASGLGTIAAGLAHVPALRLDAVGKEGLTQKPYADDPWDAPIGEALDALADANRKLMDAMAPVASYNATITEAVKNAAKLDTCTVADITKEITIDPPGSSQTLKTGVPFTISASAAIGSPYAILSGALGDAADTSKDLVRILDKPETKGSWQVFRILQEKPAASQQQVALTFYVDRTGARRQVLLMLDTNPAPKPAAQAPVAPKPSDDNQVPPKNADTTSDYEMKTLSAGKLKEVQKALKVKADGVFGPETRRAIGKFVGGDKPDTRLSAALVDKILAAAKTDAATKPPAPPGNAGAAPKGAQNEFESKLGIDQLKALQAKLNVSATGEFSPETRAAIKRRQGGETPSGRLDKDLAERILKGA